MRAHLTSLFIAALVGCASTPPAPAGDGDAAKAPVADAAKAAGKAAAAKIPDFTLETVDGERFTLSEHVGQEVIVMSFWATWCQPCLAELPHLDALYQQEKDNGLLVVAVSMDEPTSQAEVAPTVARLGLTMPVVLDTEQRAVALYNRSRNAPMTVVIDKGGQVVRASAGYNPGDEEHLAEEVRGLLAQ
ncbi:MAG: TlpA family protein disulfide reductase [Myxococcales bacterium]|nr:TlpA family protein disulfide reductase [Myxococcales bacterium]